jgi:hypothetical protein
VANAHLQAIRAANRTTRELKRLFDKLGSAEHPRGRVVSAYRVARRAIKGNFDSPQAVQEALDVLSLAVRGIAADELRDAIDLGTEQAARELDVYDVPAQPAFVSDLDAMRAIEATVIQQTTQVAALAMTTTDEALAIGDDMRVGILTPSTVNVEIARWLTLIALTAIDDTTAVSLELAGASNDFLRQAIATIDERTTDTCLRAHGQTTEVDGQFKLTGTPRFADEMDRPPFHFYCRTSVALVPREDADDDLTERMRMLAKEERDFRADIAQQIADLKARIVEAGGTPDAIGRADESAEVKGLKTQIRGLQRALAAEIHPSNAFSRRGR